MMKDALVVRYLNEKVSEVMRAHVHATSSETGRTVDLVRGIQNDITDILLGIQQENHPMFTEMGEK